ncbi:MAG TPA: carboxypeptidase-like regulatory domain-containing protein [Cyclobacteriaceae bacterium]|nr:carboxypeptidase-like regulatory domain-containing protein [Cyclobacteriaceae bacterium]
MRLTFTLLAIIYSVTAYSQTCSTVSGTVAEQNGDVLPGANIRLKSNPSTGVSSSPDGKFSIAVKSADTLIVSFIGYEERMVPVGNGLCTVSIVLTALSKTMDEVVVTGTRLIAEEFKTNNFNQLDVYRNPSSKADPILAVNALPSSTTLDESANISLRGSSPAETGIFLDNVPIHDAVRYSQLNGIGTFSLFNTQLINKVQVFPGNPPLEFGGTTSGLIALDTRAIIPAKPSHKLSLTLASIGWFSEFATGKRSALTVFSNYQPSFLLKAVNETSLARLKKFDSNDLGIHWYLKTRSNGQLKIFNYSLRETYKFNYIEPTFDGDFNQRKKRNFSVLSFVQPIGRAELSVNQGASFSAAKYDFAASAFQLKLTDYYTSLNIQKIGKTVDVKAGITREVRYSDFKGTFNTYDYAVGEQYPHTSARESSKLVVTELYGYTKYHAFDKVSLGAGVRTNLDYVSYQANGRYEISGPLALLISYGQYNKKELQDVFIQSDQLSADLVYKKRSDEGTLSLFMKKVKNGPATNHIQGAELYYKYVKSSKLQAQVSLTTLNAPSSQYDIKYYVRGNVIWTFRPTWSFSTVLLYRQGTLYNPVIETRFDEHLGVYVPTYAANEDQARLPYYGNISCNMSKLYTIAERFSAVAFVGLNNVINRRNVRGYMYNFDYTEKTEDLLSGRTLFFGTMINF